MKPEQALYNLIKDHLPGHHQRIESVAGVGAPDIELCYEGKSCWIELKAPPKQCSEWDMLRPSQQIWHFRRVKERGIVFLIYRYNNTVTVTKGISDFMRGNTVLYQFVWCQSKPWNWEAFKSVIIGGLQ